jgi:uroporphyrinogen-III synthase
MSGAPELRVLLTRPRRDSEDTARVLAEHNIEAVIAPLIEISDIAGGPPDLEHDLDGVQALLVTSANGARALARATQRRDIPVFAVGDASAAAATQSGFVQVASADGDVAALAALVRGQLTPEDGALLHAAGSAVAGDLAGDLSAHGFTVRRAQLYRAQTADNLPAAAQNALRDGKIDAALFYSPRTAGQFAKLVMATGLEPACRNMIAVCLSPAVAEAIADLPFAEIRIAASPEQAALIAILTQ